MKHAERVGTAKFRARLASYLKQARSGRPVVIQERGRDAYVLMRLDQPPAHVFGCMRDRTEYEEGAVVNAAEAWSAGTLP